MIDIGANLLRGQRARTILAKHLLIRCVLTYGANTYTYDKTKLKQISHIQQGYSHKANVLVDDTDKTLHSLDLEGYKAVMSYGLITKAGEEWVPTAPMWLAGQDRDSYRTRLECGFELEGIFDRMGKHKAESTITLESTDTQKVKDLLTGLADTTLTDGTNTPYSNYPAYTITFDSEDDLIDTFIPADGFRVNLNETRLAKWKELMSYTDCVSRIGNDGAIHILNPTTSGTIFAYIYDLVTGRDNHNYFNKRFRRRIVSPNYITFMNHPSHSDSYTGFANDASGDLTDMQEYETHYVRATSNAQCTNLANALLLKKQLDAEKGSGVIPFMNFGQEIHDYVNFVDARAGDSRAGNVGHKVVSYQPGQLSMRLGFGRLPIGVPALQGVGTETDQRLTPENLLPLIENLYSYIEQLIDIVGQKADIDDVNEILLALYEDAYFRKATVTQQLLIPSEAA